MRNEKGMTLVELLISIVIVGLIIVPLFVILTGTFTRTVEQGKDTQLAYFGQEIMERIRVEGYVDGTSPTTYYCLNDQGCVTEEDPDITYDAVATITASTPTYTTTPSSLEFYEIKADIVPIDKQINTLELVTVVKK
ncbi:type IV pilus modification PilV family protein [Aquibacillus salsiterrae]|uniref:Type II secretion system GspH family protein n=1 Tax=Aquibacillus salsiterrae TaxID=2950439 RepID=A0A9X4AEJ2_9BACI|nr:type II secretion system protein [Aquibacillus salsiterrae]MDC3416977.1 type II secretion system GspH family protein [Aquibacillus salsiterrae]